MNTTLIVCFIILICIMALVFLPSLFLSNNAKEAAQREYEAYIKRLSLINKQYLPHLKQLVENLNVINFWLKTGQDPHDEATLEAERIAADRYKRKLMTPQEAKEYEKVKNQSMSQRADFIEPDKKVKEMRQKTFFVSGLDPSDVDQPEMEFNYETEYGELIYYCVTDDALKKKFYKNVIYFTTARPANIPMVFPHKYDGAQMLSLYKHPAQAVWFLSNWKEIRNAMEERVEEVVDLDDNITDFDV